MFSSCLCHKHPCTWPHLSHPIGAVNYYLDGALTRPQLNKFRCINNWEIVSEMLCMRVHWISAHSLKLCWETSVISQNSFRVELWIRTLYSLLWSSEHCKPWRRWGCLISFKSCLASQHFQIRREDRRVCVSVCLLRWSLSCTAVSVDIWRSCALVRSGCWSRSIWWSSSKERLYISSYSSFIPWVLPMIICAAFCLSDRLSCSTW